jgi:hypothetical protein
MRALFLFSVLVALAGACETEPDLTVYVAEPDLIAPVYATEPDLTPALIASIAFEPASMAFEPALIAAEYVEG